MQRSKIMLIILAVPCALVFIVLMAWTVGIRFNRSPSVPVGIYLADDRRPDKGDLVFVEPPNCPAVEEACRRGYVLRGLFGFQYERLIKPVAAIGGDIVSIESSGVTVNGQKLANTVPLDEDSFGRELHPCWLYQYKLGPDEVLLISNHSRRSFDSRYFGPVNRSQIESVVCPLFTW